MNKKIGLAASAGLLTVLVGFGSPVYGQESPAPGNAEFVGDPRSNAELADEAEGRIERMIAILNEMDTIFTKMTSPSVTGTPPNAPRSETEREPAQRATETEQPAQETLPLQPEVSPPSTEEEQPLLLDEAPTPPIEEQTIPRSEEEAQPFYREDQTFPEQPAELWEQEQKRRTPPENTEPSIALPPYEPEPSEPYAPQNLTEPTLPRWKSPIIEPEDTYPLEPDTDDMPDFEEREAWEENEIREQPLVGNADKYGLGI